MPGSVTQNSCHKHKIQTEFQDPGFGLVQPWLSRGVESGPTAGSALSVSLPFRESEGIWNAYSRSTALTVEATESLGTMLQRNRQVHRHWEAFSVPHPGRNCPGEALGAQQLPAPPSRTYFLEPSPPCRGCEAVDLHCEPRPGSLGRRAKMNPVGWEKALARCCMVLPFPHPLAG